MQFIHYFAGWPRCSSSQLTQQKIAGVVAVSIIVAGIIVIVFIIKKIKKSHHGINIKELLGLAAILGVSFITLVVAFFAGLAISPVCS